MDKINRDYIEEYLRELLPEKDNLKDMEAYAKENHVPIIEPEVGQFLKVLLQMQDPKRILEIGTAIGYSASLMAENTSDKTIIDTIERRRDMVELAEKNIKALGYEDRINVLEGEALDILEKLDKKYDFIFMDAAKGHYKEFFDHCMELIEPKGIIVCDNVLFRGMVASDELVKRRKITIVKRLREFLKYISDIKGYTSSIIPIGDGLAIIYREEE